MIKMKLYCLGSGSSGNCYILRAESGQMLIIECGVKYPLIQRAICWKPQDVAGCLITHRHRDHCKSLPDVIRAGIKCYAIDDVYASFPLKTRFMCEQIIANETITIGEFAVMTFNVMHDVECLGFVISHPEMGHTLFLTDSVYSAYRIKGLNHILIEANYSDKKLQSNIDSGLEPASMRDRLLNTHMEVSNTIKILEETDLNYVNEVILIHLSSRNADKLLFKQEVMEKTGIPVYVAEQGFEIGLNKDRY